MNNTARKAPPASLQPAAILDYFPPTPLAFSLKTQRCLCHVTTSNPLFLHTCYIRDTRCGRTPKAKCQTMPGEGEEIKAF